MNNEEVLADESAVEQAKDYLRQGDTIEFFEKLATRLLTHQPSDPVDYSLEYVETLMNAAPGTRLDPEAATTHATPVANREEESKYTKTHRISDFLDKWVLSFVAEKRGANTADPLQAKKERLEFHFQYLKKLAESQSPH
eukprot:Rhum_TRINITY_DN3025_c0_g1::Rhum_TRINITY_DN3025_c0_g1_i1::g.9274::m.9274